MKNSHHFYNRFKRHIQQINVRVLASSHFNHSALVFYMNGINSNSLALPQLQLVLANSLARMNGFAPDEIPRREIVRIFNSI